MTQERAKFIGGLAGFFIGAVFLAPGLSLAPTEIAPLVLAIGLFGVIPLAIGAGLLVGNAWATPDRPPTRVGRRNTR